jgi:hypothetical protein
MPSPSRDPAVVLRGRFQKGFMEWQGNGMACVNQTRPHCVNHMGKTQSKALAERHGNGLVYVNRPLGIQYPDRDLTVGTSLTEQVFPRSGPRSRLEQCLRHGEKYRSKG